MHDNEVSCGFLKGPISQSLLDVMLGLKFNFFGCRSTVEFLNFAEMGLRGKGRNKLVYTETNE